MLEIWFQNYTHSIILVMQQKNNFYFIALYFLNLLSNLILTDTL
jgi:hypothetical protein